MIQALDRNYIIDCMVPGVGLILRGRLWLGSVILLTAMIVMSIVLILSIISPDILLHETMWFLLGAYGLLALIAVLLQVFMNRKAVYDQRLVRQLHHECSMHFLTGSTDQAFDSARDLCATCSSLVGPWQLLALIADSAGDYKAARKARAKAEEIIASE